MYKRSGFCTLKKKVRDKVLKKGVLQVVTENVLEEAVEFYPKFESRHAWRSKGITKNCSKCSHCIGKQASGIVRMVKVSGELHNWNPPSPEEVLGICIWGEVPKILCPRSNPRKCQYFNEDD